MPVTGTVSCCPRRTWALAVPRSGEWLYDDPMAEGQWNLRNKGTESWQRSGADVGLTDDCWQQYHGDKRIVVAQTMNGLGLAEAARSKA